MESLHERHITDMSYLMRLVNTVNTLVMTGRPMNKALHEVAHAHGLTKADVHALTKLINTKGE